MTGITLEDGKMGYATLEDGRMGTQPWRTENWDMQPWRIAWVSLPFLLRHT